MTNNPIARREFLGQLGAGSTGLMLAGGLAAKAQAAPQAPASDRKIKVGVVGYGVCRFGAAFGFQDHPNVEIVAVSDLFPDRRAGLMKACRCDKSYESLEELIKDPQIEAVFVATDAPSHARQCVDVLNHGKHVMTAVPATYGSIEEGEQVLEAVKKTGHKYMMAETSSYRADCYAMRQAYQAGALGQLVYSEGEYYHYFGKPIPSYKNWRVGLPPMWYPTHSTAYYVGVTGKRFTSVSCQGVPGEIAMFQSGNNSYDNRFSDEIALFETSEGGASRMLVCWGVQGHHGEKGRIFGNQGSMVGSVDAKQSAQVAANPLGEPDAVIGAVYHGTAKKLPDMARPPLPKGMPAGGHGGSHGHLTHEFISSILEDRNPLVDIYESLAMTVPGIVAHQSALKDGESLPIPQYERPTT